jgi:Asp-tRNA(Asn)/Glu-tRNA(Gln) amidotransferase A subunit family amidase
LEYQDYDAIGLAELVSNGETTPSELLETAIGEIERLNPVLNAVNRTMYDEARDSIEQGLPDGPFTGVPFLLKDLRAAYAGVPTVAGSAFFVDKVPSHDSELVRRYKAAGLVIAGKTNTPEFGGAPTTEPSLYGPTRNPWNLDHSSGGSSGGSAAAVAAGMVPAAHGSDGGGSIRIPAACCGIFGIKPTRGRNPSGPDFGEAWNGLSAEHVLSRTVRDSAALLDATAGPELGDPYSVPPPTEPFLASVSRPPGRLSVAMTTSTAAGPAHPDCVEAVEKTAELLSQLGHEVTEDSPEWDRLAAGAAFRLLIAANVQASIDEYAEEKGRPPNNDELENVIRVLAGESYESTSIDLVRATWAVHRAGRAVAPFFEKYDVWLSPTVATPPPPLGMIDMTTDDIDSYLVTVFGYIPFTAIANFAGLPAMSVPLHWNADGLPIGTHFVAGYARDNLLFSLAGQLENAQPWNDRRPPVR